MWSAVVQPLGNFYGVAYGNGRFIATAHGQSGPTPTMQSLDKGKTWQLTGGIPNQANITPESLRFGNGMFVAWASGLAIASSVDGASWAITDPTTHIFSLAALEFGNGTFVLVNGISAQIAVATTNLAAFVSVTPPAQVARCWWDSAHSRWLLIESGGVRCWTTTDFMTFTQRGNMPQNGASVTTYNIAQSSRTGTIVLVYNGGVSTASYTDDGGDTWHSSGSLPVNQLDNVIYGNGIFIGIANIGGYTLVSADEGRTWNLGNFLTQEKSWIVAYNGKNSYAAVGSSGSSDTVANVGDC